MSFSRSGLVWVGMWVLGFGVLRCGGGDGPGDPPGRGGTGADAGSSGSAGAGRGGSGGKGGSSGSAGAGRGGKGGSSGSTGAGRGGQAGDAGSSTGGVGGEAGDPGGAAGTGGSGEPCDGVTCSGHGACVVEQGEARCTCDTGYERPALQPTSCVDIDECDTNNGGCDLLTSCTNTGGGRTCGACPMGYEGDGESGCTLACQGAPTGSCPCIHVAPNGDDTLGASSSGASPFRTVQAAIDFADMNRDVSVSVCVAGGANCSTLGSYPGPNAAALTMKNGISVYGSYESTGWTRCNAITTELLLLTAAGVSFGDDVQSPTSLDRFRVEHASVANAAGITVVGATGVRLVSLEVGGAVMSGAVGVDVADGASVVVFDSVIDLAGFRDPTVALRSLDSSVIVEECTLRAEGENSIEITTAWLERSPGSEIIASVIEANGVPGNDPGDIGNIVRAVRILGDAEGVNIEGNSVLATGAAVDLVAIDVEACGAAHPRIFDNSSIRSRRTSADMLAVSQPLTAIRVRGDCHPRIESNDLIVAGDPLSNGPTGISCGAAQGVASSCAIVENSDIHVEADATVFSGGGVGIDCADGSCSEITRNTVSGILMQGMLRRARVYQSFGVRVSNASTLVDGNTIGLGCGTGAGLSGTARVQNNVIRGRTGCSLTSNGATIPTSYAIVGGGDVHSNYLDGAGGPVPPDFCTSAAVGNPAGTFRNNILVAGSCETRYHFVGVPNALENNDFSPTGSPSGLVAQTAQGPVLASTLGQLATLPAMSVSGNFAASCGPVRSTGDACVDAGTSVGAPTLDMGGQARGTPPDVGPDELDP